MNLDAIIVMLLGTFATANAAQIDQIVDDAADNVIKAVNDSGTQIDDVAARLLADKLERFSARVKAGV